MMITPINDNVIIKVEKIEENIVSDGGIVIAQNNGQAKPDKGEVAAIGTGRITLNGDVIPMKVASGDKIIFNRFAGTEVVIEGEVYLIIKEADILAKIK